MRGTEPVKAAATGNVPRPERNASNSLHRLLTLLDPDLKVAAEKYERLRLRLIRFFEGQDLSCAAPELVIKPPVVGVSPAREPTVSALPAMSNAAPALTTTAEVSGMAFVLAAPSCNTPPATVVLPP